MLSIVTPNSNEVQEITVSLDEIARLGAQRMLAEALQLEVADYLSEHKELRDDNGRAVVVRNGMSIKRKVTLGGGSVEVEVPRVNDRRDDRKYTSKILPPYMRKSPNVEALLPVLYLKGLSTGDFRTALTDILGEGVSGLSPASIVNLKKSWEGEFDDWKKRFINTNYAYIWADGVYVKVRLGEDKRQCLLVLIGVTNEGVKELIAVEPGHRESQESWAVLLRDLKKRGLSAPLLAVGDGALGFWSALKNVFPGTEAQRCWVHKIANVLDKLPKKIQPKAKELLHEMMYSETAADALEARVRFNVAFSPKYEKSVECITKDWDQLMTYYSFPAAHWAHLRTTNPIESTFATIKLRTKRTKGAGSTKAACAMAFKLMQEAEKRWNRIRGYEEIQRLISGVEYKDGVVVIKDSRREAANT